MIQNTLWGIGFVSLSDIEGRHFHCARRQPIKDEEDLRLNTWWNYLDAACSSDYFLRLEAIGIKYLFKRTEAANSCVIQLILCDVMLP